MKTKGLSRRCYIMQLWWVTACRRGWWDGRGSRGGGAGSSVVVKGVIKSKRCCAAVTPVNLLPVRDRRVTPSTSVDFNDPWVIYSCVWLGLQKCMCFYHATGYVLYVCVSSGYGREEMEERMTRVLNHAALGCHGTACMCVCVCVCSCSLGQWNK